MLEGLWVELQIGQLLREVARVGTLLLELTEVRGFLSNRPYGGISQKLDDLRWFSQRFHFLKRLGQVSETALQIFEKIIVVFVDFFDFLLQLSKKVSVLLNLELQGVDLFGV